MLTLPDLTPLPLWYEENKRDLPWRHTKNPYHIWVSEIMLQQTRVEAVLPYYHRFLDTLPTVKALAEAPAELLLKLWEGLGYYSRVRNMQKAAKSIMDAHNGVFPHTYEEIRALCGIGDYTAGAIASFAFGLPHPAVDGNVLRVTARLTAFPENILANTSKKILTDAVANELIRHAPDTFNQALMELGATVCLPNGAPKCALCPLADRCLARAEEKTDTIPLRAKPAPRKKELRTVLVLRVGDTVALQKRPETGLLSGLFEPFCLDGRLTESEVLTALQARHLFPLRIAPLGDAKHIFSHVEWHMTGYEIILDERAIPHLPTGCFLAPREEIDAHYALPSAYRAYRPYL